MKISTSFYDALDLRFKAIWEEMYHVPAKQTKMKRKLTRRQIIHLLACEWECECGEWHKREE